MRFGTADHALPPPVLDHRLGDLGIWAIEAETTAREVEDLVLDIIRDRRMTCVIVTHNSDQARRIAELTMIIEGGKMVAFGPTNEVLADG